MTAPAISLPNPVHSIIHPQNWVRPTGNNEFQLTKNAAQHIAAGGPAANDYAEHIVTHPAAYAMISGKVVEHRSGDGVITILRSDGWRIVSAHLLINDLFKSFYLGRSVVVGQQIGNVSNTYPDPSVHLLEHIHIQVGKNVVNDKPWFDPWPLLAQNQFVILNGVGSNIRLGHSLSSTIYAYSASDGIRRKSDNKLLEPLSYRFDVQYPAFNSGDGLVWIKCTLNGLTVYIWQKLIHFALA